MINPDYDYLKFESNSHSSFRMNGYLPNIQYSLDGETFIDYTPDEHINFNDTFYIQWEGVLFDNAIIGILELQGENIKVSGRLLHGDVPYAYHGLFRHCHNITDASELVLSSETVGEFSYFEMFSDCSNLTLVPELPATTLSESCYSHMFYGCSNLTTVPELPATTFVEYCYDSMFSFCTSLTHVPDLIDTDVEFAYKEMFYGCTGLEEFLELTDEQYNSYTYSGIFDKCTPEVMTFNLRTTRSVEPVLQAPSNLTDTEDWLGFINVGSTNATIKFSNFSPTLYYSTNGSSFSRYYTIFSSTKTIAAGGSIYFKWTGALKTSSNNSTIITTSGDLLNVSGRLLHGDSQYSYCSLFNNSKQIKDASNISLPATTLGNNCYNMMFYNCTSLTTAPELPATTLGNDCYNMMFQGCTSLTTAPELPATTLGNSCYYYMFYNCTNLTNAPAILPATTLGNSCYMMMFYNCKYITTAPELPATTLALNCYNSMFQGCTSLTTAPELPATTLGNNCYNSMFQGCTSLTTAPELPATTATDSCYSSMFSDCTSLTAGPSILPATDLAGYCYSSMFYNCTNLTTSPEMAAVPTDKLGYQCYYSMFQGCSSLKKVTMLNPTAPTGTNYISKTFDGTPSTKVLIISAGATGYSTTWARTTWASVNSYLPTEEINYMVSSNGTANVYSSNKVSETLTIPSTVTYNGNTYSVGKVSRNSLADDNVVKTLTIESGINRIEASALSGCYNLETVNMTTSVSRIDNHAFWMCRNLKNIVLPSTLTKLKPEMFVDCISLEEITIPNGITKIPFRMFEGCKNLITVNLPSTITEIQWSAFKDCVSLTNITIPSGCTVDSTAFEGTTITV